MLYTSTHSYQSRELGRVIEVCACIHTCCTKPPGKNEEHGKALLKAIYRKTSYVHSHLASNLASNTDQPKRVSITGENSNQDRICLLAKLLYYIRFCTHRGSYLLWSPVIITHSVRKYKHRVYTNIHIKWCLYFRTE